MSTLSLTWIIALNVKTKTIKFLDENEGETLQPQDKIVLHWAPEAQTTKQNKIHRASSKFKISAQVTQLRILKANSILEEKIHNIFI